MKNILITGSNGTIGAVLREGLSKNHHVVGMDLPEGDISDYELLSRAMQGMDVAIHVAHSTNENWRSGSIDLVNVRMEMNVFNVAIKANVGRIIMASSVHADNFNDYEGSELLTVPGSYKPGSPYGTHKLIVEEMGKFYAERYGVEFIGVRFGGVTDDNSVKTHLKEPAVWLSHRDLLGAIAAGVEASEVPDGFVVFHAVSNNDGRIHAIDNPFGWQPVDNSKDHLKP